MKKIFLAGMILLISTPLFSDEPKATDLLLGFYKSYDEEKNTVVIMAAYQELTLQTEGVNPEAFRNVFLSDMIEAGVYMENGGLVMTSLVNHGMPKNEEEFQKIIAGYQERRNLIIDGR